MNKFALERALAYEQLSRWLDKYKDDYAENSEFADLKLARALVVEKEGDARFISPKEIQAALVLYHIVNIEACIETGEAGEVLDGETNLTHLLKSLKAHIVVLTKLNNNEFTATDYDETKSIAVISNKIFNKREKQYEVIHSAIEDLGYDRMLIPYGGKSEIKKKCLSQPDIFFSENTFDKVWKYGRKLDLFKLENHEKYLGK